jgi:acetyl esterase
MTDETGPLPPSPRELLPLHPLLRADIDARRTRPTYRDLGVAEVRRSFRTTQTSGAPTAFIASVINDTIATDHGQLRVRFYRPGNATGPLIVYFHGGGFAIGDLDTHDRNARDLAASTGATLMSVGYRLAPEHPFPAAVEDALAATRHAHLNAARLNIDPTRICVAGDSAGATLAIVTALELRDSTGPCLRGLLTYYPATDFTQTNSPSYGRFGDGSYGLSSDDVEWFRTLYTPNPADRLDWRCSPAMATDVARLPPTMIIAAAYDVLSDDGATFAARLTREGVPTTFRIVDGVNHGFMGAPNPPPAVAETLTLVRRWFASACDFSSG